MTTDLETLTFELALPHRPEKVWRALTDPALLSRWLLPTVGFELASGAVFTFTSEPQPGWDGVVHCKVLDVEPLQRLRYRWVVGDLDTVVTFALTPTDTGTHLAIVHTGFRADQKRNAGGARYGWNLMTGKLVELLSRTP